ncbi:42287_t:CDS:2, partial [Gigaspora margarita]
MGHIHKIYYSANARYLSDKVIKDIKTLFDRQIKKRRLKPKSIRVYDLSTISDTKLEQVLNEGKKQIE